MKAIVVQKSFNSHPVGTIIGISEELPKNHYANDGFVVGVDIPDGLNTRFLKAQYTSFDAFWSKSGEADVYQAPMTQENQPIPQNDDSWEYHPTRNGSPARWSKPGYADQYDQPPMIIVDGQEVEDTSWTYHEAVYFQSEYWSKDGESNVYSQPVILIDNFVDVVDQSWTYHPYTIQWTIVEDTEAKEKFEKKVKVEKYVKRIQYADFLIAEIAARNEDKNLTEAETIAQATTFSPIIQLLKSGSYRSARGVIAGTSPAAHITQQDIDYMLGLIDDYLAGEV